MIAVKTWSRNKVTHVSGHWNHRDQAGPVIPREIVSMHPQGPGFLKNVRIDLIQCISRFVKEEDGYRSGPRRSDFLMHDCHHPFKKIFVTFSGV